MHTKISFFELVMEYCSVRIGSETRKVNTFNCVHTELISNNPRKREKGISVALSSYLIYEIF